jgi:hypothetical protein
MRKLLLYLPLPFLIAFLIFVCLWIANGIPRTKGWPYQWCRLNSLQIDSCLNLLYLVFALRFSICFIMQAYRLYGMLMPRRKWVHLLCYRSIILKSYHKFPQQRAGYPLVLLEAWNGDLWKRSLHLDISYKGERILVGISCDVSPCYRGWADGSGGATLWLWLHSFWPIQARSTQK